jgi:hypothetical protein
MGPEEFPLLEAVSRELLMKTQETVKRLNKCCGGL